MGVIRRRKKNIVIQNAILETLKNKKIEKPEQYISIPRLKIARGKKFKVTYTVWVKGSPVVFNKEQTIKEINLERKALLKKQKQQGLKFTIAVGEAVTPE